MLGNRQNSTDKSETKRIHADQRKLADIQRLAAIGKIASKVAHELNNPMDGILRYLNLAIRSIEQENLEKPKEYLIQCRKGLLRMVGIVRELLEFSRSSYTSAEYASLEMLLEEAIKAMETGKDSSNIRVFRNYAPNVPEVKSGNLFQVFCNLIKNAFDTMDSGGELHISTMYENSTIAIEFRDTGRGFDPKHAQAIFEPFFTTKENDRGTGLGLAICKDIIERYEGRITAENSPGGGSIFTVYLKQTKMES